MLTRAAGCNSTSADVVKCKQGGSLAPHRTRITCCHGTLLEVPRSKRDSAQQLDWLAKRLCLIWRPSECESHQLALSLPARKHAVVRHLTFQNFRSWLDFVCPLQITAHQRSVRESTHPSEFRTWIALNSCQMCSERPRRTNASLSRSSTASQGIRRKTSLAKYSRMDSSIIFSIRNARPSCVRPCTKSEFHTWPQDAPTAEQDAAAVAVNNAQGASLTAFAVAQSFAVIVAPAAESAAKVKRKVQLKSAKQKDRFS
jgi:hypothetical protein